MSDTPHSKRDEARANKQPRSKRKSKRRVEEQEQVEEQGQETVGNEESTAPVKDEVDSELKQWPLAFESYVARFQNSLLTARSNHGDGAVLDKPLKLQDLTEEQHSEGMRGARTTSPSFLASALPFMFGGVPNQGPLTEMSSRGQQHAQTPISHVLVDSEKDERIDKLEQQLAQQQEQIERMHSLIESLSQRVEDTSARALSTPAQQHLPDESKEPSTPVPITSFTRDASWIEISSRIEIENGYALNGSLWDCALLMNTKPLGLAGSAYASVLLVINIAVQCVFIYMCRQGAFTSPEFDTESVLNYRQWRRSVAHSTLYVDRENQRSLASRVCNNEPGLEVAGAQADAVDRITQYLEGDAGLMMAVLCVFIWGLTVAVEIKSIIHFSHCVMTIPRRHNFLNNTLV